MFKILLVEDNEMNRDMLVRRLRRKGYQVVAAGDGREAVAVAQTQAVDLILMDLSLPVLDGWAATRLLKADPVTRTIPVIALTAHAMPGDRERALQAGCDDYDTKPVDFNRLVDKIEAQLVGDLATQGTNTKVLDLTTDGTEITAAERPSEESAPRLMQSEADEVEMS